MILKNYLILAFIAFLAIILGLLRYYYNKANQLEIENEKQKEQIQMLESSYSKISEINNKIIKTNNNLLKEQKILSDKLSKFELQANKISSKHPKLLEKKINNASNEVNKCLENISKNLPCD